jgi:hypothetical protein
MTLVASALLASFYAAARRLFSREAALCALAAFAANPLLVKYAPIALFDTLGALATIPVFWAFYLAAERRTPRAYALALAAYTIGVLARFQISPLIAAPLAFLAVDRPKELTRSPFWLMPVAAYAVASLVTGVIVALNSPLGAAGAFLNSQRDIISVYTGNFGSRIAGPLAPVGAAGWLSYPLSLARQLGAPAAALAVVGLWCSLRSEDKARRFLGIAALVSLAALSAPVNKEHRYSIAVLPIVYGALAAGLDAAAGPPRRAPLRAAAAAVLLALLPWRLTAEAWRWVSEEPSYRSPAPWSVAAALTATRPAGGCVRWRGGNVNLYNQLPSFDMDAKIATMNDLMVGFATGGRFYSENPFGPPCASALTLETPEAPQGPEKLDPRRVVARGPGWAVLQDGARLALP